MLKIKCLAIDDEYLALKIVSEYVERVPFLELRGTFKSALKAFETIEAEGIELLFLDIQMPDISGIDFLKSLKNPPFVVFTTAYQEYALEGYNFSAIDYLLKPIRFERFLTAANKVREQVALRNGFEKPSLLVNEPSTAMAEKDFCFIKSGYRQMKVYYSDILFAESIKEYVNIYTTERKFTKLQSLKSLFEELPAGKFLRIHKSFVVSVGKIDSFYGNTIEIGEHKLPIGRSYKEEVQKVLS